jgi:hypothetical protein
LKICEFRNLCELQDIEDRTYRKTNRRDGYFPEDQVKILDYGGQEIFDLLNFESDAPDTRVP